MDPPGGETSTRFEAGDLHRKIIDLSALRQVVQTARQAGKTVVHCHGCFDISRPGHDGRHRRRCLRHLSYR